MRNTFAQMSIFRWRLVIRLRTMKCLLPPNSLSEQEQHQIGLGRTVNWPPGQEVAGTLLELKQEAVHFRGLLRRLALVGVDKALAICGTACLCFCGCLGITPSPKRVKGQSGVVEKPFNLTFIQTGQTSHTEVEEKLRHFDVGIQSQGFFMARCIELDRAGKV